MPLAEAEDYYTTGAPDHALFLGGITHASVVAADVSLVPITDNPVLQRPSKRLAELFTRHDILKNNTGGPKT